MHQRKIGPFQVSAVGLGCMNMSSGYEPAVDAESKQFLARSLDVGYTFLDTASLYGAGHSERFRSKWSARR